MTEENWCDHVQVGVNARFRPVLCHTCIQYFITSVKCICAVCCGRWPPAADSVGADVGEVCWASESIPVVSEIQRPQGSASQRGMGHTTESPSSSTVSDKTYISISCGLLDEPVFFSLLPFPHITFCCWACWFTPQAAQGEGDDLWSCLLIFPHFFLVVFAHIYWSLLFSNDKLWYSVLVSC